MLEFAPRNHMHGTIIHHAGGVPFDGMPNERIATANIALVVVIDVFAAAGLTFAVVCLTFNFIFRNKRYATFF